MSRARSDEVLGHQTCISLTHLQTSLALVDEHWKDWASYLQDTEVP